jgi:hypothetical protein
VVGRAGQGSLKHGSDSSGRLSSEAHGGSWKPSASPGRWQVALDRPGRGAELLVRGTEQPGVARCGEARARVSALAPSGVHPVDQLRQLPGLDRDQRSQRHRSAGRRARTCPST